MTHSDGVSVNYFDYGTRPRITLSSLYHDEGISLAVLYCRNGIGNTAAVGVAPLAMEKSAHHFRGRRGSDGSGSTTHAIE
eukprot:scaffold14409_cov88-Skeletonema_dohrnii-CCMP3373.AAC.4